MVDIEKIVMSVRKEGEDHVRVTFSDMTEKVYRKQDWRMLMSKGRQFLLEDQDLDVDFINQRSIEKT